MITALLITIAMLLLALVGLFVSTGRVWPTLYRPVRIWVNTILVFGILTLWSLVGIVLFLLTIAWL